MCGCELEIRAVWPKGAVNNGISYRHPIPFTITHIDIVNVCADHQHVLNEPAITSWHRTGYIKLPIENPTDAQKLYVYLWRYSGQKIVTPICDCSIYGVCEDDGVVKKDLDIKEHPLVSTKSKAFESDDVVTGHKKLLALEAKKNKDILPALIAAAPDEEKLDVLDEQNKPTGAKKLKRDIKFRIVNGDLEADLEEYPLKARQKLKPIIDSEKSINKRQVLKPIIDSEKSVNKR